MNEPDTFFIRHTDAMSVDEATRKQLWDQNRIGIHFPQDKNHNLGAEDNSSVDPDDYGKRGRKPMKLMRTLATNGGYVCAEHSHYGIRVGWVRPGSPIKIMRGHWSKSSEYSGRVALLKTLELERVLDLSPEKALRVTVGRPQQGTISKWHKCKKRIGDLVDGRHSDVSLDDLGTTDQEVMCAEFLRLPVSQEQGLPRLETLLLPVGRTMKDVDIYGIGVDGKAILAQVTYRSDDSGLRSKLAALKKYASEDNGAHLVLFCNAPQQDEDNVKIFPIRRVFELFSGTKTGKCWLDSI